MLGAVAGDQDVQDLSLHLVAANVRNSFLQSFVEQLVCLGEAYLPCLGELWGVKLW